VRALPAASCPIVGQPRCMGPRRTVQLPDAP
jgi:hypothetical protein